MSKWYKVRKFYSNEISAVQFVSETPKRITYRERSWKGGPLGREENSLKESGYARFFSDFSQAKSYLLERMQTQRKHAAAKVTELADEIQKLLDLEYIEV
jgi:hypothetical protein